MPNEAFFQKNPELLGLGRHILGHLGYFWPNYQHPSWYMLRTVSPLSMFSLIQHLFLQKTKRLYPHSKYLFGIGI
jgi:hypothetical protein